MVFSVLAGGMGNADVRAMAAGEMDPTGHGLATAGRILGVIGVVLAVLALVLVVLAIVFQIGLAATGGWGGPGQWNP
ncbi:MAG: hypothetical protein JSV91_06320 [Phycisphaerales bacterium]|nr:MAG: hypothetical protein JSV91_06320 [Phycisphaerales bacterium]